MTGSAGVMALVLGETVAGAAALAFLTPLWSEVKRGFFRLVGSILLVLAVATWLTARAGAIPGDEVGRWAATLAALYAGMTLLWVALLFARKDAPARVIGIASVSAAAALLVAFAFTARQSWPIALLQLLAGAAFLGAVTDGLLLGHWYLTDRGLTRRPIDRFTDVLLGAVIVEALAVVSGGFAAVGETADFNPLLTAGALAPWIALGMVATTGLIAVMVRVTLRGSRASAVQAATGFYYLAVVTAFTAEVAVKVRFLPR
jgi:hypothetical protein